MYAATRRRAWLHNIWARVRGRPQHLLDLTQLIATRQGCNQRFSGCQAVLVSQICGSEGRSREFDTAFRPLMRANGARWRRIAHAALSGIELPPVELIRIGTHYFVRDGHHRISVARALGQIEIDATVTVWQIAGMPVDAASLPNVTRTSSDPQPIPSTEGRKDPTGAYLRALKHMHRQREANHEARTTPTR
ncbi:MAG: hypothetical protein MI924_22315 [Chloroflexales bacterium]|nr:hypothetical protein [Chloroflexales bacterium]